MYIFTIILCMELSKLIGRACWYPSFRIIFLDIVFKSRLKISFWTPFLRLRTIFKECRPETQKHYKSVLFIFSWESCIRASCSTQQLILQLKFFTFPPWKNIVIDINKSAITIIIWLFKINRYNNALSSGNHSYYYIIILGWWWIW